MYDLLAWLEGSPLGHAVRGAGLWSYGVINLTHLLGVASLFGALLILDLRLLGVWPRVPLAAVATAAEPVAQVGFVVAAVSGVCLLATNATEYAGNPFLLIKFPAIAVGVLNVVLLRRLPAWRTRATRDPTHAEARRLAFAGGVSLAAWTTAVAAGRMIGYW